MGEEDGEKAGTLLATLSLGPNTAGPAGAVTVTWCSCDQPADATGLSSKFPGGFLNVQGVCVAVRSLTDCLHPLCALASRSGQSSAHTRVYTHTHTYIHAHTSLPFVCACS